MKDQDAGELGVVVVERKKEVGSRPTSPLKSVAPGTPSSSTSEKPPLDALSPSKL